MSFEETSGSFFGIFYKSCIYWKMSNDHRGKCLVVLDLSRKMLNQHTILGTVTKGLNNLTGLLAFGGKLTIFNVLEWWVFEQEMQIWSLDNDQDSRSWSLRHDLLFNEDNSHEGIFNIPIYLAKVGFLTTNNDTTHFAKVDTKLGVTLQSLEYDCKFYKELCLVYFESIFSP